MKPSQEYHDLIDSYKVLHQEEGKFKGISLVPLVPTLIHLIKENKCGKINFTISAKNREK